MGNGCHGNRPLFGIPPESHEGNQNQYADGSPHRDPRNPHSVIKIAVAKLVVSAKALAMELELALINGVQLGESLTHRLDHAIPAGDSLTLDGEHFAPHFELNIGIRSVDYFTPRFLRHL